MVILYHTTAYTATYSFNVLNKSNNLHTLDELTQSLHETITYIEVNELEAVSIFSRGFKFIYKQTFCDSTVMLSFLNNLFTFKYARICL
jgi:hypothetical protein